MLLGIASTQATLCIMAKKGYLAFINEVQRWPSVAGKGKHRLGGSIFYIPSRGHRSEHDCLDPSCVPRSNRTEKALFRCPRWSRRGIRNFCDIRSRCLFHHSDLRRIRGADHIRNCDLSACRRAAYLYDILDAQPCAHYLIRPSWTHEASPFGPSTAKHRFARISGRRPRRRRNGRFYSCNCLFNFTSPSATRCRSWHGGVPRIVVCHIPLGQTY